jgi:hypothetical protein
VQRHAAAWFAKSTCSASIAATEGAGEGQVESASKPPAFCLKTRWANERGWRVQPGKYPTSDAAEMAALLLRISGYMVSVEQAAE